MSLLSRYIFRFHIGPFFFGSATVVFIFLMQFLVKYLDELLGKGLSVWIILQLILYNVAWMVVLAVPLGVLFATLLAFGNLSSTYEIAVMKSGGAGLLRLMRPSLFMGIALTLLLFWFNDYVLPDTNHKAKILMADIQRTRPTFALNSNKFSTDLYGYTIYAREIDSLSGKMQNITIYDYSQTNQMNIVNADSGTLNFTPDYNKMILHLYNGEIHQSQNQVGRNYKKVNFSEYLVPISSSGFGFSQSEDGVISRGQREMNIRDMSIIRDESLKRAQVYKNQVDNVIKDHIDYMLNGQKMKNNSRLIQDTMSKSQINLNIVNRLSLLSNAISNNDSQYENNRLYANEYEVEIQKKYAIPFACFVFVLVGCPLGIRSRGGNIGISAVFTLGFYVIYWACLITGESLADKGQISPFLGMWLGNIILSGFGIILFIKVNNETFTFSNLIKNLRKK